MTYTLVVETRDSTATRRPRRRAEHSKSTGGCGTCKARHIKCDEAKPGCERCKKAGKTCSGYEEEAIRPAIRRKHCHKGFRFVNSTVVESVEDEWDHPRLASESAPPTSATHQSSDLSRRERSSSPHSVISASVQSSMVEYFLNIVAPSLEAGCNDGFLLALDRKAIESCDALSKAVISLSYQYMQSLQPRKPGGDSSTRHLETSCLSAYTTALASYRTALNETYYVPVAAAQVSLVLVTVSSLRNEPEAIKAHLKGALNILRDWKTKTPLEKQPRHLRNLWGACVAQGISTFLVVRDDIIGDAISDSVNYRSEGDLMREISPESLKVDADYACVDTFNCLAEAFFDRNHGPHSNRLELLNRLAWLENGVKNCPELPSEDGLALHKVLQARILLCQIFVQASMSKYQTVYDLYTDSFTRMLDLVEEALHIKWRELAQAKESKWHYCPDIGLMPILAGAARQCRHPVVRRRALDLMLLCPEQEGVWNATEIYNACKIFIDFEEFGNYASGSTATNRYIHVPEENRVHHMWLTPSPSAGGTEGREVTKGHSHMCLRWKSDVESEVFEQCTLPLL